MTFAYRIVADSNVSPALVADTNYAIRQWSNVLQGQGELLIKVELGTALIHRSGAVVDWTYAPPPLGGVILGAPTYMTSVDSVLINNQDINGANTPDVTIRFDPAYLSTIFVDPTPETSNDIPSNENDAITVIEHEFGHALGISGGFKPDANGPYDQLQGGPVMSVFDKWIAFGSDGKPSFLGPNAVAANGGQGIPLPKYGINSPLHSQNIYHVGSGEPAYTHDVMTGYYFWDGQRPPISALDVAIIKDITGLVTVPQTRQGDLSAALTVKPSPADLWPPARSFGPKPSLNFPSAPPSQTFAAIGDMMVHHTCEFAGNA